MIPSPLSLPLSLPLLPILVCHITTTTVRMLILTASHVIRAARSPSAAVMMQVAPAAATTTLLSRTFGSRACAAPAFGAVGLTRAGVASLLKEFGVRSSAQAQSRAGAEFGGGARLSRSLTAAASSVSSLDSIKGVGSKQHHRIVYPAAASASLLPVGARMASSQGIKFVMIPSFFLVLIPHTLGMDVFSIKWTLAL